MPVPQKTKQKTSPSRVWRRKSFWVTLVCSALVIGIAAPAVINYQKGKTLAAERARFEKADKDVQAVADAIVAKAGRPNEIKKDRYCSRPSAKWEEAPLSCKTNYEIKYIAMSPEAATKIYNFVSLAGKETFGAKSVSTSNNLSTTIFGPLELGFDQKIFEKYRVSDKNLDCRVTSTYTDFSQAVNISHKTNSVSSALSVDVSCGATASKAIYRLNN